MTLKNSPSNSPVHWEYASVVALLLVWAFMLSAKLGAGLIAGLAVYSLTRFTLRWITALCLAKARHFRHPAVTRALAWLPTVLTSVIVVATLALIGLGLTSGVKFTIRTIVSQGPQLIDEAITNLNSITGSLPDTVRQQVPGNPADFFKMIKASSGDFTGYLKNFGGASFFVAVQLVFALILGTSAALLKPQGERKPLSAAWLGALEHYVECFTLLMGAQVYVSMWNTFCTALFLFAILPTFNIVLPFRELLLMFTAVASLIPAAGNIMSNTLILILSIKFGPMVAAGSLVYLFIIHKLEYFVNGYIIGRKVSASVPEMLIAIILGETAFGLPGLITAPVTYAFLKMHWKNWGWV